jgi:hypothetical protein
VKKTLAGAVGGAAALAVIFGAGSAGADNEYEGRTYAQVQGYTNNRAVIASRTGSYLPTEECIVTGNRRAKILDSSGNATTKILVDLNCNDTMTAGHPGYSVATDQGKKSQQLKQTAAKVSKAYEPAVAAGKDSWWCTDNFERCQQICEQAGTCSQELLGYLGL